YWGHASAIPVVRCAVWSRDPGRDRGGRYRAADPVAAGGRTAPGPDPVRQPAARAAAATRGGAAPGRTGRPPAVGLDLQRFLHAADAAVPARRPDGPDLGEPPGSAYLHGLHVSPQRNSDNI